MTTYTLPYFGEIDLTEQEEFDVTINLNDYEVTLMMFFQDQFMSEDTFLATKQFLRSIGEVDRLNKEAIENDFNLDGITAEYINTYLDELDEAALSDIIGVEDTDTPKEEQLLNKLRLITVSLYPDRSSDTEYVFEYAIYVGEKPGEQRLSVKTDAGGNLDHISWDN